MPSTQNQDLQALLSHTAWIRSLARRLVSDPHLADDLVQETWVAAMEHPPREDQNLRGWLTTVLKNLVRQFHRKQNRRLTREQEASRSEAVPPAADLVERVSTQKLVVEAVLELPEPYRTTILMRYFEGLPPRRIARHLGIPVATVRTRIARGLDRLRNRLDRLHGDDPRGWTGALSLLLPPPGGHATALLGVFLVDAKQKALAAGLLLTAGVLGTWAWTAAPDGKPEPELAPPSAAARSDAPAGGPGQPGEPAGGLRRAAPVPPAGTEPDAPSKPATTQRVRGHVFDVRALPAAGVTVRLAGVPQTATESDQAGRFEVEVPSGGGELIAASPGLVTVMSGVLPSPGSAAEPVLVVARSIALGGRVVDESGAPIRDARARVALPPGFRSAFSAVLDLSVEKSWAASGDAEGRFELPEVGLIPDATLLVQAEGFKAQKVALPGATDRALHVVLAKPRRSEGYLLGEVIDLSGSLVADAKVSLGLAATATDGQGAFRIELGKGGFDRRLIAMKPGHLPALKDAPAGTGWADFVVLELGGAPLSLSGAVHDEAGRALPGIKVWLADPTVFGRMDGQATAVESYLAAAATPAQVKKVLESTQGDPGAALRDLPTVTWSWVLTDAAGGFVIAGLLPREYRLVAMDPATLLRAEAGPFMAGAAGLRVAMPAGSLFEKVAGKVVSKGGAPVAGVRVCPMTDTIRLTVAPSRNSTSHAQAGAVVSDASGRFELVNVPRESVYLRLDGDSILPLEFGRGVLGGLRELAKGPMDSIEVVVSLRLHVQVELQEGTSADRLTVLDREGKPLQINVFHGRGRNTVNELEIRERRTDIFSVPEDAATLVLHAGAAEVRKVALVLRSGEVNLLKL